MRMNRRLMQNVRHALAACEESERLVERHAPEAFAAAAAVERAKPAIREMLKRLV
jgi:hypothetical protein